MIQGNSYLEKKKKSWTSLRIYWAVANDTTEYGFIIFE